MEGSIIDILIFAPLAPILGVMLFWFIQLLFIESEKYLLSKIRTKHEHEYKHLRKPLQNFNRVHIDSHFVLIFTIDHVNKIVDIYYFPHHDDVYEWKPT